MAGIVTGKVHVVHVRDGAMTAVIGGARFDGDCGVRASRDSRREFACADQRGQAELLVLGLVSTEAESYGSLPGRESQPQRPTPVFSLDLSSTGPMVAVEHDDGAVRCWSDRCGRYLRVYKHTSGVSCVRISADVLQILQGCDYNMLWVCLTLAEAAWFIDRITQMTRSRFHGTSCQRCLCGLVT